MADSRKLNVRQYVAPNVVAALLFANVLLFGPALRMGGPFTAGLATGIGVGWLILAVAGGLALRRPGAVIDERAQSIINRAAALAFWILVLACCCLSALFRSETLALKLGLEELAGILANLGLVAFGVSAFIFWRRG